MRTTKHAKKRARKRAGLPKKVVDKYAEKAYTNGLSRYEVNRKLCRYMDALRGTKPGVEIRLYNNFVWIYLYKTLMTCYHIPATYQQAATTWQRRKEENGKQLQP